MTNICARAYCDAGRRRLKFDAQLVRGRRLLFLAPFGSQVLASSVCIVWPQPVWPSRSSAAKKCSTFAPIDAYAVSHHTLPRNEHPKLQSVSRNKKNGRVIMTVESSVYRPTYMCITTNQPDTKSNPNPHSSPTTKQHGVVSIRLNIITCSTYPEKFVRDDVIAPFLLLCVVIVTLPEREHTPN